MAEPTRPVLRWHGGKWRLAPWILSWMPSHRIYVEPYGGAASVLIRKPRAYAEVYNDLDDDVVDLFKILRDPVEAAKLRDELRLTPFARAEFIRAYKSSQHRRERVRRLIVRAFMGYGSNAHSSTLKGARSTGFRSNSDRSGTTPALDWRNYPDCLDAIIERLQGVIIEKRPATDVIRAHDSRETLHYVDPPYIHATRARGNAHDLGWRMYRHELSLSDHAALLASLQGVNGMVMLSGYPHPLYDETLSSWKRVETVALADGARKRIEVLWMNPACVAALEAERMPLFAEAS